MSPALLPKPPEPVHRDRVELQRLGVVDDTVHRGGVPDGRDSEQVVRGLFLAPAVPPGASLEREDSNGQGGHSVMLPGGCDSQMPRAQVTKNRLPSAAVLTIRQPSASRLLTSLVMWPSPRRVKICTSYMPRRLPRTVSTNRSRHRIAKWFT